MIIRVDNLSDFEYFLTDAISESENIKLMMYSENRPPNFVYENTGKPFTRFTLILLSTLYSVAFSGKIKNEDYEILFNDLISYRDEQCTNSKIDVFESVKISENGLRVHNWLNSI